MTEDKQSPIFNSAPKFLKESLVFPYREGLTFVQEVMFKKGREGAFAGTMANPPTTTREIMQPGTYLAGKKVPPLPLPKLQPVLGNGYSGYDAGAMGEFDVSIFLAQFRDPEKRADNLYREWRGGNYFAALRCDLTRVTSLNRQRKTRSLPRRHRRMLWRCCISRAGQSRKPLNVSLRNIAMHCSGDISSRRESRLDGRRADHAMDDR